MAQLHSGLSSKLAGRTRVSASNGSGVGVTGLNGRAAQCQKPRLGSRVASSVACAVAMVGQEVLEETVDAIAVLEQPGTLPSTQFEAFDQASELVEGLESLNLQMAALINKANIVIECREETSQWSTNTLPSDYKQTFLDTYRKARKKEEQEKKNQRRLRRVMRSAGQTTAEPLVSQQPQDSSSPAAEEHPLSAALNHQDQLEQLATLSDATERRAKRAQQRQQRVQSPAAMAEQPTVPPVEQQVDPQQSLAGQRVKRPQQLAQAASQQQPAVRQRRRRSSTTAATAATPAALQPDRSSTAWDSEQALPQAGSRRSRLQPAATDLPSLPSRAVTASSAAASTAVMTAQGLGSSSSRVGLPSGSVQSPATGFQPLSLQQSSMTAPTRSSVARRTARAVGMSSSRSRSAAKAAETLSVQAPPTNTPKLADNNFGGLDMRADLLSAEQEKDLSLMVQDLLALERMQQELVQQLGRLPTDLEWMEVAGCAPKNETEEEFKAAVHAFQARLKHGRAAKQVMISANYKLVVAISRKYQGYGMALHDLINEGIAGLIKGVERFEAAKGCKFGTYAHWWIRQAITRSLSEQGRLVRLPSHLQEMLTKMTKISRTYEGQYGREASLEELAAELKVEPHKIQDVYEAVFVPRSLDAPMADGEGATLGDVIEDERMLDAEDAAHMESLKADMEGVLATLPPREAGVLRMRFGLLDGTEHTLDDIGLQYNVTRERIRQIEAKAIRHLRARQAQSGSVMADYQDGILEHKELASRTSSGTKKQS